MSLLEEVRIRAFFVMLGSQGPKSLSYPFLWKLGKRITRLSTLHRLHAPVFRNMWSRNEHCHVRTALHYPKIPGSSKRQPMYVSVICTDRQIASLPRG